MRLNQKGFIELAGLLIILAAGVVIGLANHKGLNEALGYPEEPAIVEVEKVVVSEKVVEKECPKAPEAPAEYPKKRFFDFSW